MQMKRKEFLEREACVYYEVYDDGRGRHSGIRRTITALSWYCVTAASRWIRQNRQSVLQGVNRPIVYHRDLDITREVLDRLNRTPRVSSRSGIRLAGDTRRGSRVEAIRLPADRAPVERSLARDPPPQAWMLPTLVPLTSTRRTPSPVRSPWTVRLLERT